MMTDGSGFGLHQFLDTRYLCFCIGLTVLYSGLYDHRATVRKMTWLVKKNIIVMSELLYLVPRVCKMMIGEAIFITQFSA